MREKKEKPKRKLPKKSQRPKRRYLLFRLEGCENAKKAFDLVMERFSLPERKSSGIWFIEFKPEAKLGIVRCKHDSVQKLKEGLDSVKGLKTLATSGTIKALRAKQGSLKPN